MNKIRYQVLSENTITVISNIDEASLGDEGIGFGILTYKGELVIPQTVEHEGVTYTVTDQITKVTLPGSIRKIGERAFYQCRGLDEEAASCTKADHEAYWTCGVCNKLFADENAETEIEAPTELPKADHSYGDGWQSSDAKHWHECAACHEKADAEGHTFKWVIDKDVTEAETGSKHEECEICGHKLAAVEVPKTEVPQTGDTSTALWIMLFALAGVALTAGMLYFRKRRA